MAAAAELLGDAGDIDGRARPKADFHSAARLFHEKQAHFHTLYAARVVDKVLAVGRGRAGLGRHVVVVPAVLVVGDDEQALLPDGLVAAQCRVDVVDELLADGQI